MESIGSHCCSSPFTFITRNSSLHRLVYFTRKVRPSHHSNQFRNFPSRLTWAASSSSTIEEQREKKKDSLGTKVKLNLRLNHQVNFGDHVAMFGSALEIGSWETKSPLTWTDNGWVSEIELSGGQVLEFKFVIVHNDGSLRWESGDNRFLKLPNSCSFLGRLPLGRHRRNP